MSQSKGKSLFALVAKKCKGLCMHSRMHGCNFRPAIAFLSLRFSTAQLHFLFSVCLFLQTQRVPVRQGLQFSCALTLFAFFC